MASVGELLTEYMTRTGISDSELARSLGVSRQTIFRWKEGLTARPRVREDVLCCAERLRLTPAERDALLLAAGFASEQARAKDDRPQPAAVSQSLLDDAPAAQTTAIPRALTQKTQRARLGMLLLLIGVAAAMVTVAFVALPSTAQNLGAWVVPPTARAARHPARGTQSV
jgi:transcriptional regulator with XRE-family HTH domain